jgi:hypothetical protein
MGQRQLGQSLNAKDPQKKAREPRVILEEARVWPLSYGQSGMARDICTK